MINLNHNRYIIQVIGFTAVLVFLLVFSAGAHEKSALSAPCSNCHLCENPTKAEPCLKSCMRSTHDRASSKHTLKESPDIIVLEVEGHEYDAPVPFNHKEHATMGQLSDGCETCHHYSPEGRIPSCGECHSQPKSLSQPGLKGAYHRQCLNCHKEWSHTTECDRCHTPNGSDIRNVKKTGNAFKKIETVEAVDLPGKKVYRSSAVQVGEKVTFYHNEHTELFGLECTDCHREENCSFCHDQQPNLTLAKSEEEVHAICNNCHKQDNCVICHGTQEKPSFQHDPSKWQLSGYHTDLECSSCHTTSNHRIISMTADCESCHSDWNQDNFNHKVVGLELDEFHGQLGCIDCHNNNRYHSKPNCENCHEDDRTPQNNPPGRYVNNNNLKVSYLHNKEVP